MFRRMNVEPEGLPCVLILKLGVRVMVLVCVLLYFLVLCLFPKGFENGEEVEENSQC